MDDMDRILEDLKSKRQALDEAIAAIERLQGTADEGDHPAGAYTGMTVISAARKYLASINRPASTKEIVAALEKGGLKHNSKDFYSSVYAILRQRAQAQGDLKRVATDWALTEELAG